MLDAVLGSIMEHLRREGKTAEDFIRDIDKNCDGELSREEVRARVCVRACVHVRAGMGLGVATSALTGGVRAHSSVWTVTERSGGGGICLRQGQRRTAEDRRDAEADQDV